MFCTKFMNDTTGAMQRREIEELEEREIEEVQGPVVKGKRSICRGKREAFLKMCAVVKMCSVKRLW